MGLTVILVSGRVDGCLGFLGLFTDGILREHLPRFSCHSVWMHEGSMPPWVWNERDTFRRCTHPFLSCLYFVPQASMVRPCVWSHSVNLSSSSRQKEEIGVAGETPIPGLVSAFIFFFFFVGERKARKQTDDKRARNPWKGIVRMVLRGCKKN